MKKMSKNISLKREKSPMPKKKKTKMKPRSDQRYAGMKPPSRAKASILVENILKALTDRGIQPTPLDRPMFSLHARILVEKSGDCKKSNPTALSFLHQVKK